MKKKKTNLQDKKNTPLAQVKKGVEQLSDAKLKEQTRWYIPSAIERLVQICNSKNEAVALGAIKVLLAKNMPDLKATELDVKDGVKFKFEIVKDTTLEDANKKDPAKDKELPSPKQDL